MSKPKRTVIKEVSFNTHPITSIKIGDPDYFREPDAVENELVFKADNISFTTEDIPINPAERNKPSPTRATIQIQEVRFEKEALTNIEVIVAIFNGSEGLLEKDAAFKNKFFPDKIEKHIWLGCDSASFEIETNLGYDRFNTGADGPYGFIYQYKDALIVEYGLPGDLFTFDEVVQRTNRLFNEPAIEQGESL